MSLEPSTGWNRSCPMSDKRKVGQELPPSRWLGYLTALLLVAAVMITCATHNPLNDLVARILSASEKKAADSPTPYSSVGGKDIESIINDIADIELLKVTVADNIRIEYLLFPRKEWQVFEGHENSMLAMTCAIRMVGPTRRPVIFAGVGRFVDGSGKSVLRSRAETMLSTLAFNLLDCSSDDTEAIIDWNEVSVYHRTFTILKWLKDID